MSPPGKIGDASLAAAVSDKFSDLDALTVAECRGLELDSAACLTLTRTLGTGTEGVITNEEKKYLIDSGFSDSFIRELTGQEISDPRESAKVLTSRVRWLADYCIWRRFRFNKSPEERALILHELGAIGPYALEASDRLLEALKEDDPKLRQAAAEALGNIPEMTHSVTALIGALRQWPPNERRVAAEALVKKGDVAAQILVMHLATDQGMDWQLSYTFLQLLGEIGRPASPVARAIVERHLHHPEMQVRNIAAWTLGEMREEHSIAALVESLGDPDSLVCWAAAQALVKIGSPAIQSLAEALRDPRRNAGFLQHAAWIPGQIKTENKEAILALLQLAADPDPGVRKEAVGSLVEIGLPAVPILLERIWDPNSVTRQKILFVLGEIRSPDEDVISFITDFLSDDDERVRRAAAEALGKYEAAARNAISALVNSLDDKEMVLNAVIEALVQIGKDAVPSLLKTLEDERGSVRLAAATALIKIGTPAIPNLIENLGHPKTRNLVAAILLKIGRPAVRGLIEAVDHSSAPVREKAVELLGEIEATDDERREAAQRILKRFGTEDPQLHDTFIIALVKIGGPAVSPLMLGLKSPFPIVRECSARALGEIGLLSPEVVPALVEKLGDSEAVRGAVLQALIRFGSLAVPFLGRALEERVRDAALEALVGIGRPAVHLLIDLLSSEHEAVRVSAATGLARIGRPAIQPLIRRLREGSISSDLVLVVAETLARIGPTAVEPLKEALDNPHPTSRICLAMALGFMGPMAVHAYDTLTQIGMSDRHPKVQKEVAKALVKIGHPGLRDLIRQLDDPDPELREFAALTLEEIGEQAKGAIPALTRRSADSEEFVRQAARSTLDRIGPPPLSLLDEILDLTQHENGVIRLEAVNEIIRMIQMGPKMRQRLRRQRELTLRLGTLADSEPLDSDLGRMAQTALEELDRP